MTDVNARFSEDGEHAWLIKYKLHCLNHLTDKFPEEMPNIQDGDLLLFIMDIANKKFTDCYNLTQSEVKWKILGKHSPRLIKRVKKMAAIFL